MGSPQTVSFGLPLPPGVLANPALVSVRDAGGQEIAAHVRSLGLWRSIPPAALLSAELPPPTIPGHRSVLVQFSRSFANATPVTVTVLLNQPRTLDVPTEVPVRSTWRLCDEGTFTGGQGVYEPKVYALLPPEWLASCNLTTLPSLSGAYWYLTSFDKGQVDFFNTVINRFNPAPDPTLLVPYKTDSEPWLYDRAQAFYNGYLRTGSLEFLREAHRASQFYMRKLYTPADEALYPGRPLRGFFRLKSGPYDYLDAKYSYNESLATLYWLTGDAEPLTHLADVTAATKLKVLLHQVPQTTSELAGWTERNVANALLAPLFEYEVTGDPALAEYLRKAVDALWEMQNHPAFGFPANGAFNHYVEEGGKSVLNFSPWMSSLLAHSLLRIYHTLGDSRIPGMLVALAQAEVDRALRQYNYGTNGQTALWVPRYVAAGYGDVTALDPIINYPNACVEHAIDVAYVTALGAYLTTDPALKERLTKATLDLIYTHNWLMRYWTRPDGWPANGAALYRMAPPRKYAWWFKNAGALGSLLGDLQTLPADAPDLASPTVTLTQPEQNAVLNGLTIAEADARDNSSIAGVRFTLDGASLGSTLTVPPYRVELSPSQLGPGQHVLRVEAWDAAGNLGESEPVTLQVPPAPLSATFQNGADGYAGARDFSINNQGGGGGATNDSGRFLTYNRTESPAYEARGLLRFDGLSLPPGARVLAATLTLSFANPSVGAGVEGRYLLARWNPTSVKTVNWLYRDTGVAWAGPGASGEGSDIIAGESFVFCPFASTTDKVKKTALDPAVVQRWIDDPATNQGVILINTATNRTLQVVSSENSDLAARPKLVIYYSTDGTTPPPTDPPPTDPSTPEDPPTPTDSVPPAVQVVSPEEGASVTGEVLVSAEATDNVAVAGVRLSLDGRALGGEIPSAPYAMEVDAAQLSVGSHVLQAEARDEAGNVAQSRPVAFEVASLDPTTVVFQNGVDGYTGARDLAISTQGASFNGGNGTTTNDYHSLLYQKTGSGAYESRVLLRFENLSLPPGARVLSASLSLNFENPVPGITVEGHYLRGSWDAGSTRYLSWLRRDATWNWTLPGASGPETDRMPLRPFTIAFTDYTKQKTVPLKTEVVQSWVDSPDTNQGVLLVNTVLDKALYVSLSEHATVSLRPRLSITYAWADTTPPAVRITSPAEGAFVKGRFTLAAEASDDVGVVGVQFLVDGTRAGSEATGVPFETLLDSAQFGPGTHTVVAIARDAAGNATTSRPSSFEVAPIVPITVSFQQGLEGYGGTQDFAISTQGASFNGGNGTTTDGARMLLYNKTGSGAYESRVLLRFDGLSLPAGAQVQSATLTLNCENPSVGMDLEGYYLQAPWNASSAATVSWLRRDANLLWAVPGASGEGTDRLKDRAFRITYDVPDKARTVALDPSVVQSWVTSPTSNQGLVLLNAAPDKAVWVSAADNATPALRPKLTLTYILP